MTVKRRAPADGPDDRSAEPPRQIESAADWGRRQAEQAPSWPDAKWRRICGLLRIAVAEPTAPRLERGNPHHG